ncbi:hypothetical protein XENORESO_002821 [Xenotaenia resolanae]|uniref:Uncharacterized protein n=1 Tax=Xenotaenia resolanae TaxID=208358 RepID=A0ABV0WPC2_9TELE
MRLRGPIAACTHERVTHTSFLEARRWRTEVRCGAVQWASRQDALFTLRVRSVWRPMGQSSHSRSFRRATAGMCLNDETHQVQCMRVQTYDFQFYCKNTP